MGAKRNERSWLEAEGRLSGELPTKADADFRPGSIHIRHQGGLSSPPAQHQPIEGRLTSERTRGGTAKRLATVGRPPLLGQ